MKPVLIRADLVHVDVVEPGRFEPADSLEVSIRIRAADDRVGDVAFGDELDGHWGGCGGLNAGAIRAEFLRVLMLPTGPDFQALVEATWTTST